MEAIRAFMNKEFGWAKIVDIGEVQAAVERRVNEKFPGSWKVHVVKLRADSSRSAYVYGAFWDHDGYTFSIMRQSE
jgi:ribosomal protein L31E